MVNSLTRQPGVRSVMATAPVMRLYRQFVSDKLRKVRLDDGSEILITRRHRLLGLHDWTRNFTVGERICVPAQLKWQGTPADPDLTALLAWQISEGHEGPYSLTITQKNSVVLDRVLDHLHQVGTTYNLKINKPAICKPGSGGTPYLRISSVAYRQFLEGLGYAWGKRSA